MVTRIEKNKSKSLTFESFINKTYGYMFSGMLVTAFITFFMLYTNVVMGLFSINNGTASLNLFGYLAFYGPFCTLLFLSFKRIDTFSIGAAKIIFFALSIMFGFMMSILVLNSSMGVVFQSLLGTSAIFAGSALIGHYTKRNLSFLGRIAYNLMFGLVIISIISLVIGSSFRSVVYSYVVIALSSVIVAYTHQNLKSVYSFFSYHSDESDKIAIFGALSLYIDFINIFTSLLNLSNRK